MPGNVEDILGNTHTHKKTLNKADAEGRTSSVNHLAYKHSSVIFIFTKSFPATEKNPHKSEQVLSNMDEYHLIKRYLS